MTFEGSEIESLELGMRQVTPLRYRLRLKGVGLRDELLGHPSGILRTITYRDHLTTRPDLRTIAGEGLVLGTVNDGPSSTVRYIVPISSRPIRYDSMLGDEGRTQTFSDSELFYDAGKLVGQLKGMFPRKSINEWVPIGQIFSVVDFVTENEPHLYLTPGIERVLHKGTAGLEAYAARMALDFPDRFSASEAEFREGFKTGFTERA